MRKSVNWPFWLVVAVMLAVTIYWNSQHVWRACWALEWFPLAQIIFFKLTEREFSTCPVERVPANATNLTTKMSLYWLTISRFWNLKFKSLANEKTVLTRPVERDLCSSIFRNACWDSAGLASFICWNDVNTSNVNIIWQLEVAGQYLYLSKSFVPGVHLPEQTRQEAAGRHRLYVPEKQK